MFIPYGHDGVDPFPLWTHLVILPIYIAYQYLGFVGWIVIVSSIWVLYDAHALGLQKSMFKGSLTLGPVGWFFSSLFIWIVGFPSYLVARNEMTKVWRVARNLQGPGSVSGPPAANRNNTVLAAARRSVAVAATALLISGLISAGFDALQSYQSVRVRDFRDIESETAVDALTIANDYDGNALVADEKYKGRQLLISAW